MKTAQCPYCGEKFTHLKDNVHIPLHYLESGNVACYGSGERPRRRADAPLWMDDPDQQGRDFFEQARDELQLCGFAVVKQMAIYSGKSSGELKCPLCLKTVRFSWQWAFICTQEGGRLMEQVHAFVSARKFDELVHGSPGDPCLQEWGDHGITFGVKPHATVSGKPAVCVSFDVAYPGPNGQIVRSRAQAVTTLAALVNIVKTLEQHPDLKHWND